MGVSTHLIMRTKFYKPRKGEGSYDISVVGIIMHLIVITVILIVISNN